MSPSTSAARLDANRANAQKSTGPRTDAGKSASRFNATTHGLTASSCLRPADEQADLDAYTARVLPGLDPQTEPEHELSLRIVSGWWRLRRMADLEDNLFANGALKRGWDPAQPGAPRGHARAVTFLEQERAFNNLSICEQRLERSTHRNIEALRKMQKERLALTEQTGAQERVEEEENEAVAAPARAELPHAFPCVVREMPLPEPAGGFVFTASQVDPAPPPLAAENAPQTMAA